MRRLALSSFGRITVPFLLLVVPSICSCSCSFSSSFLVALAAVNNNMPPGNDVSMRSPPRSSASAASTSTSRPTTSTARLGGDGSKLERQARRSRSRWLVVDFDCTVTKLDTTPTLPLLAALHSGDDDGQRQRRLGVFAKHEEEYFGTYSAVKERLLKHGGTDDNKSTISGEDDGDDASAYKSLDLDEALEALDDVSTFVTDKVSESSCLAGLPSHPHQVADIINGSDELRRLTQLQEGCTRACANAHLNGWGLAVLSINWFPSLIDAAFVMPLRRHVVSSQNIDGKDGDERKVQYMSNSDDDMHLRPRAEVWCNNVDEDGVVALRIPGAVAKRERIRILKERLTREHESAAAALSEEDSRTIRNTSTKRPLVIYVGDSSTDLLGLLEAHIGIMIGRSSTILGIAERWNIPLAPLKERRSLSSNGLHEDDSNTVWMADGWEDIEAVLADL